ncbi:MAG: pyridine nucleotide-disulfide oxidoreductase, partial [Microbacteriaceae bacterium]|nr:pyridine nucleotide-disulfide oxidoreductase [Microbacteriaceae bacterium]
RGVEYTDLNGWRHLDEHEIALGDAEGRLRVKVVPREEMVRVSNAPLASATAAPRADG